MVELMEGDTALCACSCGVLRGGVHGCAPPACCGSVIEGVSTAPLN